MTLEEKIQLKVNRLETIPEALLTDVEKLQTKLFKEVLKKIDNLERVNGNILLNDKNINLINQIGNELSGLVANSEYKEYVRSFLKEFDKQAIITNDIYKETLENFVFKDDFSKVVQLWKQNTAEKFISNHALTQEFSQPLKDIMNKALVNQSSFVDVVKDIQVNIEGDKEKLGTLRKYSGQIAWDSLAQMDRTYSYQVAKEYDAQFYLYAGGLVKDSRAFCVQKADKYFHIKEIELWPLEQWVGKIPNTDAENIFTNAGGYRCQHSFIAVGLSKVPKDVIQRNITNGNLKLNAEQKKILKIR